MMVNYTIELLVHRLPGFPINRCHDICANRTATGFSALTSAGNTKKTRTEWHFELRREIKGLADLNQAIRGRIIQEALRLRTRTEGSAPIRTCWIALIELD